MTRLSAIRKVVVILDMVSHKLILVMLFDDPFECYVLIVRNACNSIRNRALPQTTNELTTNFVKIFDLTVDYMLDIESHYVKYPLK